MDIDPAAAIAAMIATPQATRCELTFRFWHTLNGRAQRWPNRLERNMVNDVDAGLTGIAPAPAASSSDTPQAATANTAMSMAATPAAAVREKNRAGESRSAVDGYRVGICGESFAAQRDNEFDKTAPMANRAAN